MSKSETIVLAVSCNNHYVIMLAALLKSIEINHKSGEPIDVWIIDDGIKKKNQTKLISSLNKEMMTLKWIKSNDAIPTGMALPLDRNTYPLNIFMRIFIPYFTPANTEKVLYLDVDMIVNRDISDLWKVDISNHIIAAVTDATAAHIRNNVKNFAELNIPGDSKYFNSGLLLINIAKWKENNVTSNVISAVNDNRKHTQFSDQYGLNVTLVDKWLELDPLWNYYANGTHPTPYIIHFFHRKPFYRSYFNSEAYQKTFYSYLNQTNWKDSKPVSELKRYLIKLRNVVQKAPLLFRQ